MNFIGPFMPRSLLSVGSRAIPSLYEGDYTMPGKADIITYVILGAFALAIIVWAMMNTGYKGPG